MVVRWGKRKNEAADGQWPVAAAWAHAQIVALWELGVRRVLPALVADTDHPAEVRHVEHGYFHTNAPRMAYPTFRARGPLGGGGWSKPVPNTWSSSG